MQEVRLASWFSECSISQDSGVHFNENFVHLVEQILDCCVSLEVLENNESAYYCYKKVSFEEVSQNKIEKYTVMGKELNYLK